MAVTTSDSPEPRSVPRPAPREAAPVPETPPPATPTQEELDAIASGTYTMPEAKAAPKAAPKSESPWEPPPPATPSQAELDAIAEGTYPAVPRGQRDVKPEGSGEGYKTR